MSEEQNLTPPPSQPVQESRFRKEDILLYIIFFLIICTLTYVVMDTRNSTILAFEHEDSAARIPSEDMLRFESERNRYDYAAKCLISNSVRVNLGFLAGVVISLMGVILVIRQVRDTIEFGARSNTVQDINLKTTSPGVFVVFMGCMIIMAAILSKDKITLDVEPPDTPVQKVLRTVDSTRKAPPSNTADTTRATTP